MRLKAFAITLMLTCGTAPAVAQQTDNQQILELLQGLNGKLDRMEQRIDKLEQQNVAPAAQAAPAANAASTPPVAAPVAPAKVATPGWQVELYPYGGNGVQKLSTARTHLPIGEAPIKQNLKSGPVSNWVQYRGRAFFKAPAKGTYGFQLTVERRRTGPVLTKRFGCLAEVFIEDQPVIPQQEERVDFAITGSVDLQEGIFEITYAISCRGAFEAWTETPSQAAVDVLAHTFFNVQVIDPDDNEFRDFEPAELFTVSTK